MRTKMNAQDIEMILTTNLEEWKKVPMLNKLKVLTIS